MLKLQDLERGQSGIVARLDTRNENILRKLMSMGIMPGVKVSVVQTYPSYVFKAGFTQVAVDSEIASVILLDI